MVKLDTETWQFCDVEVPRRLWNLLCSFVVGETNDGTPCIVYAKTFEVGFLLRGTDSDDGAERWVTDRVVPLDTELGQILGKIMHNCDGLKVVAVRDGIEYLATMKEFIGELVTS
ncbi:hypothetical protein PR202_ga10584 [Eleusine coracana subsp. coracana]|uniref:Uncharacterized protein n=1 Tax=Eleusine coracana subsp. coracana TaxID=191504 RepID=A0AAV5C766_ELECO|nr:hypothetical protein PR202_ga10584 [Eleusine coracana subsp. coracana]